MHAENSAINVVVVGVGLHGLELCKQLLALGYSVVGAIDTGERAGSKLDDLLSDGAKTGVTVAKSVDQFLSDTHSLTPHVAVLAAATDSAIIVDIAAQFMAKGVNVITLHQDLFEPDSSWAPKLDAIGRSTGASFMSTGVQDTWYVHLPNLIAASTLHLREITYSSVVDLESLSAEVGHEIGVGLDEDEFRAHATVMMEYPAVLGAPLREAARKMGFTVRTSERTISPIMTPNPFLWRRANREIAEQHAIGMTEHFRFETDSGVAFTGVMTVRPLDVGEETRDTLDVIGAPNIHVEIRPFPGGEITNTGLLNRIPDVLGHPGGVMFSADLNPARYHSENRKR